ncbi:MAG: 3'(2'),5'-bisphosphate nucleotidase CysQ [Pseudomonadales bacterium]|nr:3'(2'),5'-bisphosphate nucleotidase CysQ [Pseudomonadales bacterium]MCP5170985.1 3'(2'),5'-bisphosphate nucleotidase CysQ [Pseudomonadales bacterium]MCP5301777.1 3'(2'),5'-bisphosphate nucleotidase CysQ [Pseudomonadales bacterium]
MNFHSDNALDQIPVKAVLKSVVEIARQAGEAILTIYNSVESINVTMKSDNSPLTAADLTANRIICDGLGALLPGVPVLSEEAEIPGYEERSSWRRYWLVDPLDGTKEFIQRNGEFTVNIALIENGVPVMGVVYVPVKRISYWGGQGLGAFKCENGVEAAIQTCKLQDGKPVTVVASRRHGVDALTKLLGRVTGKFNSVEILNIGSSLKLCLVAEGVADFYPRMAPTSEWDTAAAQAIVEAAGGRVVDDNLSVLRYNMKADLLNPYFYVIGDTEYDWPGVLA